MYYYDRQFLYGKEKQNVSLEIFTETLMCRTQHNRSYNKPS